MKLVKVTVPWRNGLHLRHATRLVQTALRFHSHMVVKCGERVADARSILSVCALCATMNTVLEVEVSGDDEGEAAQTVERVFAP
jgi:phosphotransferase system HPr (HPr) family protein